MKSPILMLFSFVILSSGFVAEKATARSLSVSVLAQTLSRQRRGLRKKVLRLALRAYVCARRRGNIRKPILSVIDYSLPSKKRRLWVFDLKTSRLLWHEWVAHGKGSGNGRGRVRKLTNRPHSKASSIGLFRTGRTYFGKHGLSLRLKGLERGFNHHARKRHIVMHGASYVSRAFVRRHGRLGRSWGCPAVRKRVHKRMIRRLQRGSALFVYYPSRRWLRRSRFLHCR